ncbi:MAG: FAD binding domain-containing protein [Phreatobacter sp.]
MYAFNYHRPASVDEAASLIDGHEDAKLLAGGQTLLPTMKQRLAAPALIVDLGGIASLRGITVEDDAVRVGAMTRHGDLAADRAVAGVFPGLGRLANSIGDPAVRNRGTIGGSLANFDPAADYPAALLAVNGTIETNRRAIKAVDFFLGLFETALEEGEIIIRVSWPIPRRSGWEKFRNPASRYAIAAVFVADMNGEPGVGVTGAGQNGAFRSEDIEAALRAKGFAPEALDGVSISEDDMNSDMHADAAYRAHLVVAVARLAVAGMS